MDGGSDRGVVACRSSLVGSTSSPHAVGAAVRWDSASRSARSLAEASVSIGGADISRAGVGVSNASRAGTGVPDAAPLCAAGSARGAVDERDVALLLSMGFGEDVAKRALRIGRNACLERATQWIVEHAEVRGGEKDHRWAVAERPAPSVRDEETTQCERCGARVARGEMQEHDDRHFAADLAEAERGAEPGAASRRRDAARQKSAARQSGPRQANISGFFHASHASTKRRRR